GARLIAVPGCPLPTFWTASMASTRTVSTARSSTSVQARSGVVLTALLRDSVPRAIDTRGRQLRPYSGPPIDSHSDLRRPDGPAQRARRPRRVRGDRVGARRGGGVRRADQ